MSVFPRPGTKNLWMQHRAGGKRHRMTTGTSDEAEASKIDQEWTRKLDEHYSVKRTEIRLSTAIGKFLEHCRSSRLARRTISGYAHRLGDFMEHAGNIDISTWMCDDARRVVRNYVERRSSRVTNVANVRVPLGTFFNYLRAEELFKGENPADAKLQPKRRPRKQLKKPKRRTSREEDIVLRLEGAITRLWLVILLTRWAGMRRGEACTLRWSEIDLDACRADVVGHEGGKKHPRVVWLSDWVVDELRKARPSGLPKKADQPVWPYHPDTASDDMKEFCQKHGLRRITFNDLRSSFTTGCFDNGLSAKQESKIVGHSAAVAEKHYDEYEAAEARHKLSGDPLGPDDGCGAAPRPVRLRIVPPPVSSSDGHSDGHSRTRVGGTGA